MEKDHLEIILEDIHGKFDLVLEGHDGLRKEIQDTRQDLCEKISLLDFKVDTIHQSLDKKIDAVAVDIKEHRADTEVHKKVYKVKEE